MSTRYLKLVLVLALMGLGLVAYAPRIDAQEDRDLGEAAKLVFEEFKDTGEELKQDDPVEHDWALIEIRNKVDRAITVTFSGKRQYEFKVGPESEEAVKVHAGKYTVRASASALKDAKDKFKVEDAHIYKLRIAAQK